MLVILVWVFFAMPLVTGQALTPMAVLYWLMGYPQAKIADWIHRKFKVTERRHRRTPSPSSGRPTCEARY